MSVSGIVFNIQRFSIHDGPGIRTTVFLKGCPNRCFWCQNPEGLHREIELRYHAARCVNCGNCVAVCTVHGQEFNDGRHMFHRDKCIVCGKCTEVCHTDALEINGRRLTVEQVLEEVLEDRVFFKETNGGVTLSGGEPMFQKDFSVEIMKLLKSEDIHTAIETSANCSWEDMLEILPFTDLIMMDIKQVDPEKHTEATGVSNSHILKNAKLLMNTNKKVIFRVPIIPSVNDTTDKFIPIARFVKEMTEARNGVKSAAELPADIPELELIPFHKLGVEKFASLDLKCNMDGFEALTKKSIDDLRTIAIDYGINIR